jgi:hypothetical protein
MATPIKPGEVGPLERLNSFINNSATIVEKAGAQLNAPAHKAVMYDADGNVVLATSGEKAIGTVLSSSPDPIAAGAPVHILIKYIGLLAAGGAIAKGDLVTIDANGQGVPAQTGDFIFGRAYTAANEAGEAVQVQINPMGFLA